MTEKKNDILKGIAAVKDHAHVASYKKGANAVNLAAEFKARNVDVAKDKQK